MLPSFSFSFDGLVWRIVPDLQSSYLIAEIRHSSHKVSFSVIDLLSRTLFWNGWTPNESWWSSLIGVNNGVLFVQTFPDGQNPDPRDIIALQIETQKICWQQSDFRFVQFLSGDRILARKIKEALSEYFLLDLITGQIIESTIEPVLENVPTDSRLTFPVHYTLEDDYFQIVAGFLSDTLKILPEIALDYAETEHSIVISYYIYVENLIENYLVIFDTHSRVPLLHEKIATQRTGIGKDTFFIFEQLLIFVKEQTLLLGYEI